MSTFRISWTTLLEESLRSIRELMKISSKPNLLLRNSTIILEISKNSISDRLWIRRITKEERRGWKKDRNRELRTAIQFTSIINVKRRFSTRTTSRLISSWRNKTGLKKLSEQSWRRSSSTSLWWDLRISFSMKKPTILRLSRVVWFRGRCLIISIDKLWAPQKSITEERTGWFRRWPPPQFWLTYTKIWKLLLMTKKTFKRRNISMRWSNLK